VGQGRTSVGRGIARLVLGVVAVAALGACQTVRTTQSGVVGVDRMQTMSPLVSPTQVNSMAVQQYSTTVADAEKKGALNRNPQQVKRVRGIGTRLIAQTGAFRPDAAQWPWEVNVITSDELNAWCMPGGKIAVYTGLIDKLQLTDAELAAVMGHEISHALREHSREKMSKAVPAQVLMSVVGVAYGDGAAQLGGQAYQLLVGLPNSREMETEADRMGVELMARAGYDPAASVSVLRKMQQAAKGQTPQFLSTHPSNETRINDLEDYSQRVEPLYQQAKAGR
jgi:predicted Zn-dependent protease